MMRSVADKLAWALTGALLVVAVTGCGLKGDLYLPEPEQTAATDQNRNADETDAAKTILTAPDAATEAADKNKEKAVSKPSESTPLQP